MDYFGVVIVPTKITTHYFDVVSMLYSVGMISSELFVLQFSLECTKENVLNYNFPILCI